jgi:hypothetical protein
MSGTNPKGVEMNTSDFAQRLADKLIAQLQEGTPRGRSRGSKGNPLDPTTRRPEIGIGGSMFWH